MPEEDSAGQGRPDPVDEPAAGGAATPAPRSAADGGVHRLDPRVVTMNRIVGLVVTICVSLAILIGLVIALVVGSMPGVRLTQLLAVWILASAALGWFCYVWPPVEFRHTSYRLDEDGIEISHGVFWRSVISVPRSRVQHLDVSQGPLQRSLGLGTLRIYTAGTEYAQVDLAGLEHARALQVRDYLLPREAVDVV